jgi:hypothetical protein
MKQNDSQRIPDRLLFLLRLYKSLALLILNTLLLFLAINILSSLLLFCLNEATGESYWKEVALNLPVSKVLQKAHLYFGTPVDLARVESMLEASSPQMTVQEQGRLVKETWERPLVFEAYTGFKESTFRGKYVNVSPFGYRQGVNNLPWPPREGALNVFVLGGSTTFGYGVRDDQTIPAYLQEFLAQAINQDVRVYNFGRAFYHSTQERILLENLLLDSVVPSLVVTIDGLNDFNYRGGSFQRARKFDCAFEKKAPRGKDSHLSKSEWVTKVIDRLFANLRIENALSREFGFQVLNVIQPVPTFNYNPKLPAGGEKVARVRRGLFTGLGYPKLKERISRLSVHSQLLWLGDMQVGRSEALYVDAVHYTPGFSRDIAKEIATHLLKNQLIG